MYPPHLFICFFDEWLFRGDESKGRQCCRQVLHKTSVLKANFLLTSTLGHPKNFSRRFRRTIER